MVSHRNATAALLVALRDCRDLDRGKQLHSQAAKSGSLTSIRVASSLIAMYARSGSMPDAREVFDAIPFKNAVPWTALILGYAANGSPELALELFERMDCRPDARAFLAAVVACSSLAEREGCSKDFHGMIIKVVSLEKGMAIHSRVAKDSGCEFSFDLFLASSLIEMYAKCGSVLDLRTVFDRMPLHDVVSWTGLIGAYVQNNDPELALELFEHMKVVSCCCPNSRTFVAVLMACARLAVKDHGSKRTLARMKGVAIHSHAAEMGFEKDVFVASSLVDMYAKCGCLGEARAVFDTITRPNAVSWNSLLLGCMENGEHELALQLFREMMQRGNCAPDNRTFVAALMACSGIGAKEEDGKAIDGKLVKLGSLETGMAIHCQASKSHLDCDGYVASTLVDTYSSCGSMLDARRIFDRMPQHDLVAWNALVRGYAENGEPELAVELYQQMESQGCAPDGRTFLAALAACGNLAALEAGRRIHDDVRRHRAESDTFVANALIDFYGKCGSPVEAQGVFDSMEVSARNLVTWSALISGYSRQGDSRRVFDLFQAMRQQRIQPDRITLASVLTACSHTGLADQGKLLLETMVPRFGITPDLGHYNCLVDMLGRANRLDEAVEVATTMPLDANAVTWKTVLGACHKWNNVKLARLAFQSLERLEGRADASSLVLYRNIVGRETPRWS